MSHVQRQTNIEEDKIFNYSANHRGTGKIAYDVVGTIGSVSPEFIGPKNFRQILTERIYEGLENGDKGGIFLIQVAEEGLVRKLKKGDRFKARVRSGRAETYEEL